MARVSPTWTRVALALLALPNLVTGVWALVAPRHWFDHFPGWAPRLVAAHPPYNDHLAADAGAGLLAIGALAGLAALVPRRHVIVTAMFGFLAFSAPHALFHLTHEGEGASGADRAAEVLPLLVATVLAAFIALDTLTRPEEAPT